MGRSICHQGRKRAESALTFIWGKHQKNQKEKVKSLRILKMRVQESFTNREGISTPCTRHKGQQPLIECANHDFNIIYFPFFIFLLFWGQQGCFPRSYVSSGAMRNSDLHSSFVIYSKWFTLQWIAKKNTFINFLLYLLFHCFLFIFSQCITSNFLF